MSVESPFHTGNNREARRTIAEHGFTGQILQGSLRGSEVFAECLGLERCNALVMEAVRCYFVARVRDGSNDFGPVLGQPSEDEERAANAVLIEAAQKGIDAVPNATRTGEPLVTRHH